MRRPQLPLALLVLGREELEGERPLARRDEVADARCRRRARPWTEVLALRTAGGRVAVRGASTATARPGHAPPPGTPPAFRAAVSPRSTRSSTSRPRGSRRSATDAARLLAAARARRSPAASGSGRRSATGATARSRRRPTTRRRWSGPAPRWSCCTRARWCTTTTWTPPTPAAAGPSTHRPSRREHRERRLARRPRAVRRRRRDPARRPAAVLVRRAAAHAAGCPPTPWSHGPGLLRHHPQRGHHRPVPRRVGAGARRRPTSTGDDGCCATSPRSTPSSGRSTSAPRSPAATPRRPAALTGVRAAARRGLPAPRRPARRLRRPGRRPASPPATTSSRASAPCWSRWRSTAAPADGREALLDAALGTPLPPTRSSELRRHHRRLAAPTRRWRR